MSKTASLAFMLSVWITKGRSTVIPNLLMMVATHIAVLAVGEMLTNSASVVERVIRPCLLDFYRTGLLAKKII